MYLIVYKGKDAQALQENNSAEIPNTYKIQPFPPSLIIATSVPKGAWGRRTEVRGQNDKSQIPSTKLQINLKFQY
jgi:hypothetical protein